MGANDYVTKPFDKDVLIARIRATLRQVQTERRPQTSTPLTVGDLTIDPAGHTLTIGDKSIDLTLLMFDACGSPLPTTFTTSSAGTYEITVSVSDPGAGTYNTTPAKFTLKVLAPADSTPPVITPLVSGTLGNNGWYTSDVTVAWIVSDPESAVTFTSGCDPVLISSDTAGTTLTCSATSAGSTSSQSVTIKRDATAPIIDGSRSPLANVFGWNNSAVTMSFTCSDAMSGIASCSPSQTLSGEGTAQSASGNAVDNAGNAASTTVGDINIDKTAPSLTWIGSITDGDSFYFGFVPAAPTCSASDALSGVNGGCSVSGYGTTVGAHTMSASASDYASNVASESRNYSVLAWTLSGFYNPVDMGGVFNTVKSGSTVPLKFEIFAGPTELTSTSAVQSLAAKQIACSSGPEDAIEMVSSGSTVLRYDDTAGAHSLLRPGERGRRLSRLIRRSVVANGETAGRHVLRTFAQSPQNRYKRADIQALMADG